MTFHYVKVKLHLSSMPTHNCSCCVAEIQLSLQYPLKAVQVLDSIMAFLLTQSCLRLAAQAQCVLARCVLALADGASCEVQVVEAQDASWSVDSLAPVARAALDQAFVSYEKVGV